MPAGFVNNFASGEISEDGWDRIDIQPVQHGCEAATNMVVQIPGPLRKRRGFWYLGAVADQTKMGRLIPFRRGVADALMLEFGDSIVRVWQANGSPLISGGVQVSFASPYSAAQAQLLRFKQVVDVIYLRTSDGEAPQTLARTTNTNWAFIVESFPNGPWQPENVDQASTITIASLTSGGSLQDQAFASTSCGSVLTGAVVQIVASKPIFAAGHVGTTMRLRQGTGNASCSSWIAGYEQPTDRFALSNSRVYYANPGAGGAANANVTNPPVQLAGDQSDGVNVWTYLHDGSGALLITAVADSTHATATVLSNLPLYTGQNSFCWSWAAYSAYFGWPTTWPELVEERLVNGATASNPDFLDLTGTATFYPDHETFSPGTGTGLVLATDALRRRLGSDGAQIQWACAATFLICGTDSGEYVVSGGLFGDPLSPSTIVVRQISDYGSEAVYPAQARKGLFFVTTGGQTLRQIRLDLQQNDLGDDVTVLARHIGARMFAELAWIKQPDEVLFTRLGDGGFACFTYHQEQDVKGWTTQQLPGGWICENVVNLPGPGRLETCWMIVSRTKAAATQRAIIMQSQVSDGLFMDLAQLYAGAATATIDGLDFLDGETVRVLANGVQIEDQPVVAGAVAVPAGTTQALVGLAYQCNFKSLKLATMMDGQLNQRQQITGATVNLRCVQAYVGMDGSIRQTLIDTRSTASLEAPAPVIQAQNVEFSGDVSRDPRIVIIEDSAYDFEIFSIRPIEGDDG